MFQCAACGKKYFNVLSLKWISGKDPIPKNLNLWADLYLIAATCIIYVKVDIGRLTKRENSLFIIIEKLATV